MRLYVSCATPGTKHWWVDVLEADTVEGLEAAERRTVLPGDARHAVKDPVIAPDATAGTCGRRCTRSRSPTRRTE